MIVMHPKRGIPPAQSITERTRSKVTPPVAEEPLVTPESQEKDTCGNKVKKKDENKSPSNAEKRADTLKLKHDALAKILADKEEAAEKEKEKEHMAKLTADREKNSKEGKEKNTETPEKKRRQKKTKDKDRLTVDTGEPGDGDAPTVDEVMIAADGNDEEWKKVAKNGKGIYSHLSS